METEEEYPANLVKGLQKNLKASAFPCKQCDRAFSTQQLLINHLWVKHHVIDMIRKFTCSFCNTSFKFEKSLKLHLTLHKEEELEIKVELGSGTDSEAPAAAEPIQRLNRKEQITPTDQASPDHKPDENPMLPCPVCTKDVRKRSLRFHIRRHNNEAMVPCPVCSKQVKKKSLSDHVRRHDITKKYECDICDKLFWTSNHLSLHMNTHLKPEEKPEFPCNLCDFKTSHTKYLKSHMQRQHTESQHCTVCDKKFRNEALLIRHSKKHNSEKDAKIYKCEECDKSYTTPDGLRVHVNSVHKGINHICPYPECTKSYANISGLNYHVGTHDPAVSDLHELFPCPICKQKFKKDYLPKHVSRHDVSNKKHRCDVCEDSFFSTGALNRHKITHLPTDAISCEFCDFKAAHPDYLNTHMKRMHSQIQNPHGCSFCGKRFLFLHNLTEHLEIHKSKAPGAEIEPSEFEYRSGTDADKKKKDTNKRSSGNGLGWWKSACKLGMLSKVSK